MKSKMFLFVLTIIYSQFSFAQKRTNSLDQDVELGKVSWYRDYNAAIRLSEKENKPVLILFQEVPGCSTCRNYGHNVLSHPLMTEAIENEFIPLAIFNNKGGKDLEILKKYKEPAWSNPVVRIVNSNGENIVNRVASDYSANRLYSAMIMSLEKQGKSIPSYLKILGQELSTTIKNHNIQETHFKMYCFWTGEKELGSQEGVLATKTGFMGNAEVVRVIYDGDAIDKTKLEKFAQANKMLPIEGKNDFEWSSNDEDYFIQHSYYKYLPLSEVQKTKINSALGLKESPLEYLSPRQRSWLKKLDAAKNEVLYNQDFFESWDRLGKN